MTHSFTKEQLEGFVQGCKTILKNGPECTRVGICCNLDSLVGYNQDAYVFVEYFSPSWEHFSGSKAYPVRNNVTPEFAATHPDYKWEGEQLELRMDLLRHLISKGEAMLKEME